VAFHHGKAAEITVNSVALSTFCDTADLSIDIDTADTTTFGASWKTAIAGLAGGELEIAGNFDPTATTGPASALSDLIGVAPFAVIYEPAGAASTQHRTFNAILTNYSESSPVGDKVTFSATLLITGAVTFES
jgi:hypothetical protein